MPETITVQHEGQEIEVAIPDTYVRRDQLAQTHLERSVVDDQYVTKESMQETINKRFKAWTPKDKAAEDPDVVQAVLASSGNEKVDLNRAKEEWRKNELTPLKQENNVLRTLTLSDEIDAALATAGYEDPAGLLRDSLMKRFRFDAEAGHHVAYEGKHKMPSLNPTESRQYAGPGEFVKRWSESDAGKAYLPPTPKNRGSGLGTGKVEGEGPPKRKRSEMTLAEKVAFANEFGHDELLKLPK